MSRTHRHRLAHLLVACLVVLSAIALSAVRVGAQDKSDEGSPAQASQSINGVPLQVVVQDNLAMEVYYEGREQFFQNTAGGTFVIVDGVIYGSDPPASGNLAAIPLTPLANGPVTGGGTAADPFRIVTAVAAGTTGVQVTQTTTYVNGEVKYDIQFNVANTGPAAHAVRIVHGADLYLNFPNNTPDLGLGFYDPATGAVGASSQDGSVIQVFIPGTPPTAYQEAFYANFWESIGTAGAVGPGFNNTIDPTYHDVAAGLQWDRNLAPGAADTIVMAGAFGLAEVALPSPTPIPSPTATSPIGPSPTATSPIGPSPTAIPTEIATPVVEEPAGNPANVTVAHRLSPNHAAARGSVVTHEIVVVNRGEGMSEDVTLTLPFDPGRVRVLDARFSSEAGWVSELNADSLRIRTGSLAGNGGRLVATVRMEVLPTAPIGASLSNRITFIWEDQVDGGSGISNLPVLVVGAADDNRQTYTLSVTPPAGPAGTVHQIDGFIFVPNEPVGVWYNAPSGEVVALETYYADEAGNLFLDLSTDDTPAGAYSLVMYGLWSEFTAVGPFTIE